MNLAIVKPVLLQQIANASGLNAVWRDQQLPFVDGAYVECSLLPIAPANAVDEIRHEYDDDPLLVGSGTTVGTELSVEVHAMRTVALQCKVESYDLRDGYSAVIYVERLRNRLNSLVLGDALRAVNVAIANVGASIDLGEVVRDDHRVSVAALDVMLLAGVGEEIERTTHIEKMLVTSNVEGASVNDTREIE
jgi:hypothetical protein